MNTLAPGRQPSQLENINKSFIHIILEEKKKERWKRTGIAID